MNDRFIEDLKSRVDLVQVAQKYSEFKKAGKNFMGRSPFRNERTPSFSICPQKQVWYDFGSSEGGDVISFLEKAENLSFREAVEFLADSAGVEIPQNFGREKVAVKKEVKKDIFALHEAAAGFFARELAGSEKAKKYLAERKISAKISQKWQLGFGGENPSGLTEFLLKSGFSEAKIAESGVAFAREFGTRKMRDRFFGRIIVPIREMREGKIVAFSARILPETENSKETAKYLNSPENPVYVKSSTLFGLEKARKKIAETGVVVLVEGNFDVISSHEAGVENAVATCGTSLTESHLRALARMSSDFLLAFDTDLAGKKATLRGVEMILKMGKNVKIIEISGAKDVDSLCQKSPEKWQEAARNAQNALEFLADKFFQKFCGKVKNLETEKKFLDGYFYFLQFCRRPLEIDASAENLAKMLGRGKSVILAEFSSFRRRTPAARERAARDGERKKFSRAEIFVGFLAEFEDFFREKIEAHFEEIKSLLEEGSEVAEVFEKKFSGQKLDEKSENQLRGWGLFCGNLYEKDAPQSVLETDFETFIGWLRRQKQNADRIQRAKNLQL